MNQELAEDGRLDFEEGDILVVFSNGLRDNILPSAMVQCLERDLKDSILQDKRANALCLA